MKFSLSILALAVTLATAAPAAEAVPALEERQYGLGVRIYSLEFVRLS